MKPYLTLENQIQEFSQQLADILPPEENFLDLADAQQLEFCKVKKQLIACYLDYCKVAIQNKDYDIAARQMSHAFNLDPTVKNPIEHQEDTIPVMQEPTFSPHGEENFLTGIRYKFMIGVEQDFDMAKRFFQKALEQKNMESALHYVLACDPSSWETTKFFTEMGEYFSGSLTPEQTPTEFTPITDEHRSTALAFVGRFILSNTQDKDSITKIYLAQPCITLSAQKGNISGLHALALFYFRETNKSFSKILKLLNTVRRYWPDETDENFKKSAIEKLRSNRIEDTKYFRAFLENDLDNISGLIQNDPRLRLKNNHFQNIFFKYDMLAFFQSSALPEFIQSEKGKETMAYIISFFQNQPQPLNHSLESSIFETLVFLIKEVELYHLPLDEQMSELLTTLVNLVDLSNTKRQHVEPLLLFLLGLGEGLENPTNVKSKQLTYAIVTLWDKSQLQNTPSKSDLNKLLAKHLVKHCFNKQYEIKLGIAFSANDISLLAFAYKMDNTTFITAAFIETKLQKNIKQAAQVLNWLQDTNNPDNTPIPQNDEAGQNLEINAVPKRYEL